MARINSTDQLGFVQLENTYGTIPNTGGTASVAAADAFLSSQLTMSPAQGTIDRPDKTGAPGQLLGIGDRKSATWSMRCSAAGSGTPGVAPDIGPFLQALFGKAPTIVADTSVTYGLDKADPSLTIWNFWDPANATQEVIFGAIVQSARLTAGGSVAEWQFNGIGKWLLSSDEYTSLTNGNPAKGGLTQASFPTKPASPVTAGDISQGFLMTVTIDGNSFAIVRSIEIGFEMARELPNDTCGQGQASFYTQGPAHGRRAITIDLNLYDDSGNVNLSSLKAKAKSKTPVPMVIAMGETAGNIWTPTFNEVLIGVPETDDSGIAKAISLRGCRAHMSDLNTQNEVILALT